MKKFLFSIVFYGLFSFCFPFFASAWQTTETTMQEIVVSANKIETPVDGTTSSVSVVSPEDIEAQQPLMLVDVLRNVPGIYMNTQEGLGGMNGISIRGAHPRYTQYRYNGIPMRDTAETQANFSVFLGTMMMFPNQNSFVEVLKGSQGTLYGSNAIGGVVSIFTEPKWETGSNASIRLGGGSYGTAAFNAELAYGDENFYIDFKPQIMHTDGHRGIWQDQGGYDLGAGYRLSKDTSLEFFSMMSLANHADYESQYYDLAVKEFIPQKANDKDYRHTRQVFLNALTLTHDFSDKWQTVAKLAYTRTDRAHQDAPDIYNPASFSKYRGDNYFADIYNKIMLTEQTTLIVGMDYEGQRAKALNAYNMQDNSSNMYSVYAKLIQTLFDEKLTFNLGSRYNYHEDLGSHGTWDMGLSYQLPTNTRLYAHIATGYRTPSLYETYGDGENYVAANTNLNPETSVNYELGLEQKVWDDRIVLTANVFKTDYKDKIDYLTISPWPDTLIQYINKNEVKEKGYELGASIVPADWLRIDLSFVRVLSETQADNGSWAETTDQMPDNKFIATVYCYPIDDLTLSATARWEDSKAVYGYYDSAIGSVYVKEDTFFTVDLSATYDMTENLQIFAKVNNLLNEEYTVLGWEMPGMTVLGGVQYGF